MPKVEILALIAKIHWNLTSQTYGSTHQDRTIFLIILLREYKLTLM